MYHTDTVYVSGNRQEYHIKKATIPITGNQDDSSEAGILIDTDLQKNRMQEFIKCECSNR